MTNKQIAFLVTDKEPNDNNTLKLTCIKYDANVYAKDFDFASTSYLLVSAGVYLITETQQRLSA